MAKGLQKLMARGSSMRNDTSMTARAQHPQNKDPEDVTPGPQYQQKGDKSGGMPVKIKLPKALVSDAHKSGAKVMHLAEGHHVKNDDGSTSFHMKALDGEPISADDVEPPAESSEDGSGGTGAGMDGSPYGIAEALKGMSA